MNDPVDTDALRRDARVLAPGFPGVEKRLDAAADEVDRLRAFEVGVEAVRQVQYQEQERLRSVIENAPHDYGCKHVDWVDGLLQLGDCTCWKADAL